MIEAWLVGVEKSFRDYIKDLKSNVKPKLKSTLTPKIGQKLSFPNVLLLTYVFSLLTLLFYSIFY